MGRGRPDRWEYEHSVQLVSRRENLLIANARSSASASNPSQSPELAAELWDEVGGVLAVGGLDEVVIVIGGFLLRSHVGRGWVLIDSPNWEV